MLTGFLHDLGIALNYKDDPRLRFAYVLKPDWVTGGIGDRAEETPSSTAPRAPAAISSRGSSFTGQSMPIFLRQPHG